VLGYYVSNRDEAYTTNGFLDVPCQSSAGRIAAHCIGRHYRVALSESMSDGIRLVQSLPQ